MLTAFYKHWRRNKTVRNSSMYEQLRSCGYWCLTSSINLRSRVIKKMISLMLHQNRHTLSVILLNKFRQIKCTKECMAAINTFIGWCRSIAQKLHSWCAIIFILKCTNSCTLITMKRAHCICLNRRIQIKLTTINII